MTIKTHCIGFDREKAVDSATTRTQIKEDLPDWMERDAHTYDPVAFLVECWSMPPDINRPMVQAIQGPDAPGPAQRYSERSLARVDETEERPEIAAENELPFLPKTAIFRNEVGHSETISSS